MEDTPRPKPKGNSKWKRPPTKVYAYNYDVGEHYYKPMMRHLDRKSAGLSPEPPGPKTFAERLVEDPLHPNLKPLDKVSSDYTPSKAPPSKVDEYVPKKSAADDDLANGADDGLPSRPSRFTLPSVSDQILEGAGVNTDTSLDEFLANLRKRREQQQAETDELLKDPFFAKSGALRAAAKGGEDDEDLIKPRRNILNDLNSVAKMEDSSLGNYSTANLRKLALNESLAASSSMQSQVTSSVNIRKRNVKTTITTETVRY